MFHSTALAVVLLLVDASVAGNCSPPTIQLELKNCTFSEANQTDVQSNGVLLSAGGSAELCAMPSTVVNSTLLQSSEICSKDWLTIGNFTMTPAQCRSRRGGFVVRSELPTATTDGLDALNTGWFSIMTTDGLEPFQFATQATLEMRDESVSMIEGLITQGQDHTMSHLGLGEQSTLLGSLKDAGLIGAKSWGLNSGSQSYLFPRDGSLVLGGYDESGFDGPFFNYSIAKPNLLNNRPCPLQITITDMTLNISIGNGNASLSKRFVSQENPLKVCLEPYDLLFRLPDSYFQDFKNMFTKASNNEPVDSSQYKSLYDLEPGLVYTSSAGNFSTSLRITVDNGLTVTIPSHELVRPLRGLDANGVEIVDTSFNEVLFFGGNVLENSPVFGRSFLSQLYLFVDLESSSFHLANQNLEANTPLPKSSASCPPEPTLSKTDKGLISIGVVLAVILVAAASYATWRWCKKRL